MLRERKRKDKVLSTLDMVEKRMGVLIHMGRWVGWYHVVAELRLEGC